MPEETKTDNFLMRTWLKTIQSIAGENGLKSILNYAHLEEYIDNFPPDNDLLEIPVKDAQALFHSLYELFGRKCTRSFQLRLGQEFARIGINMRSKMAKALQIATYLLPETKKMHLILEKVAQQGVERYTSSSCQPFIEVREEDDWFLLIHRERFESNGISSTAPVCNVYAGMLQYFMQWISGHPHHVEEIECRAMGHPADVFRILKKKEDQ
jgi:predicted hydrocarbon binding protein